MVASGKKKVLFVQHAGLGGAVISLSQILRKLDRAKFDPTVLMLRNDPKAMQLLQDCGAQVILNDRLSLFWHATVAWRPLYNPWNVYRLLHSLVRLPSSFRYFKRTLEYLGPSLVYLNALPLFHYAYVARKLQIPVIFHVREPVHSGHFGVRRWIHRRCAACYVTKAIFTEKYDVEALDFNGDYEVIPNYVDLTEWNPADYSSEKPEDTGLVILFMGGLGKTKGISTLISALVLLKQRDKSFRCVICGFYSSSGRFRQVKYILRKLGIKLPRDRILARVEKLDIKENCVFKPFIVSPIQEYAQSDVLVFPSTVPHFPRPIIEAGAMGLPVVASNLPGPRDVVVQGKSGLLVPPNDPAALAKAVFELLSNPQKRREMGAFGRQIVEERYNEAINGARILDIIEMLCEGK